MILVFDSLQDPFSMSSVHCGVVLLLKIVMLGFVEFVPFPALNFDTDISKLQNLIYHNSL